jgi:hypothetical protein
LDDDDELVGPTDAEAIARTLRETGL